MVPLCKTAHKFSLKIRSRFFALSFHFCSLSSSSSFLLLFNKHNSNKNVCCVVQSIISSHHYKPTYKPSLIHPWTQTSPNSLFRTAIYLTSEKFSENCSGRLSMALKAYQENCWACSMTLAVLYCDQVLTVAWRAHALILAFYNVLLHTYTCWA